MNYVKEIADLYLALNPRQEILDPVGYTIIAEWEKQEIPLSIVLAAINKGCENCEKATAGIESIGCFQEAIQKNYLYWLQTPAVES